MLYVVFWSDFLSNHRALFQKTIIFYKCKSIDVAEDKFSYFLNQTNVGWLVGQRFEKHKNKFKVIYCNY